MFMDYAAYTQIANMYVCVLGDAPMKTFKNSNIPVVIQRLVTPDLHCGQRKIALYKISTYSFKKFLNNFVT